MCVIIKKVAVLFVLLFLLNGNNFAQVTTTISAGPNWKDALLLKSLRPSESGMANTNYGTYPRLAATAWTHSGYQITYRSLLQFDLAFIPAGTTVTSAVLYLNSDPAYSTGELSNQYPNSFYFQKVTQSWNPTSVTWNTQPSTTTAGRIWTASAGNGNIQADITTLVQGMVNSPSTNYGIQMILETESYHRSRTYASTDHPNTALRPKLVITYAGSPDPLKDRMDYIFGGLNQSDINTGILTDYGIDLADHTLFNGTISANNEIDVHNWYALYASLLSSVINPSSSMIPLSTINQNIDNFGATYNRDNPTIDLPTLFIAYQTLRSDALTLNLITNNNERLTDVPGRTQSPYLTGYAFATAPTLATDNDGNVNFVFRSTLFVNSSSKTLSTFQVDFNNGAGYQNMTFDTPKNIIYTTPGIKTLSFRIQFTDGTIYFGHSKFYVLGIPQAVSQMGFGNGDQRSFIFPRLTDTNCPESFPNPESLGGILYGAKVTVEYGTIGSRPSLGCTPQFIKPLIVLEGFDASKITGDPNRGFNEFINEDQKGGINIDSDPILPGVQLFSNRLEAAGYDIVFVDFKEGTGDIVKNALLVENIIRWVNLHKINNPNNGGAREGTVLLGQSMGGVIARYAVCDLEKRWLANATINPPHEVRMLICQDSPHQGANVPVGFQTLVNDLANTRLTKLGLATFGTIGALIGSQLKVKDVVKKIRDSEKLLNQEEGPKEMLIAQDGRTNTFLTGTYRPMITFTPGYVPSFFTRAIANGSECGAGSITAPGAELLNVNASLYIHPILLMSTLNAATLTVTNGEPGLTMIVNSVLYVLVPLAGKKYKANFVVRATPLSGTNMAYNGKITLEKKIFHIIPVTIDLFNSGRASVAGALPFDTAPGGYVDLQEDKKRLPGVANLSFYPIIETGLSIIKAKTFTHAPAVSTLDITTSPLTTTALATPYSNGNTTLSRFQSFDTQEYYSAEPVGSVNNSKHIQFTAQNANWIFHEMEGEPISNSCSYTCTGGAAHPYILGPSYIECGNGTYIIKNLLPAGVSITWTLGGNLTYVSGQGTSNYTVQGFGSGTGWVQATINGGCGEIALPQYPISIAASGIPSDQLIVQGQRYVCTNSCAYEFSVNNLSGVPILEYQWWLPSGFSVLQQSGNSIVVCSGPYVDFESIEVYVRTACTGWQGQWFFVIEEGQSCPSMASFSVTPNPVSSQLTVELTNIENNSSISMVQLLDGDGNVVKESNSVSRKIQLDTQALPKGVYYLKVLVDGEPSTTRILIE